MPAQSQPGNHRHHGAVLRQNIRQPQAGLRRAEQYVHAGAAHRYRNGSGGVGSDAAGRGQGSGLSRHHEVDRSGI